MSEICVSEHRQINRSSEDKRRTQIPSFSLVTNMKEAEPRIIYSLCTIIASRERLGLLALWSAYRSMDPEDQGLFPDGRLFF